MQTVGAASDWRRGLRWLVAVRRASRFGRSRGRWRARRTPSGPHGSAGSTPMRLRARTGRVWRRGGRCPSHVRGSSAPKKSSGSSTRAGARTGDRCGWPSWSAGIGPRSGRCSSVMTCRKAGRPTFRRFESSQPGALPHIDAHPAPRFLTCTPMRGHYASGPLQGRSSSEAPAKSSSRAAARRVRTVRVERRRPSDARAASAAG